MESKFVPWYETEISNKILNGEFFFHITFLRDP